jgi:hypothetical protein
MKMTIIFIFIPKNLISHYKMLNTGPQAWSDAFKDVGDRKGLDLEL